MDAQKRAPLLETCLVSEREARYNNQTCRHVSPHAAEWRSLQLRVTACRILSTLRALSSLRSLARCVRHTIFACICVYLDVFSCICAFLHICACTCSYLRVFARICAYLQVSARICTYFVRLCAFLLVSARICTYSQELLKIMSKCSKKGSQNDPQNRPKTIPKSTPGGSQDGVWLLRVFGVNFGSFEQLSRGPKLTKNHAKNNARI